MWFLRRELNLLCIARRQCKFLWARVKLDVSEGRDWLGTIRSEGIGWRVEIRAWGRGVPSWLWVVIGWVTSGGDEWDKGGGVIWGRGWCVGEETEEVGGGRSACLGGGLLCGRGRGDKRGKGQLGQGGMTWMDWEGGGELWKKAEWWRKDVSRDWTGVRPRRWIHWRQRDVRWWFFWISLTCIPCGKDST